VTDEKKHNRREFEEAMVLRAWKDEAFKKELITNTKEVIERELNNLVQEGVTIPANMSLTVLEEGKDQLYMVLPQNPMAVAEEELTDEELEAVAGGTISVVAVVGVTVVGAVNFTAAINTSMAANVAAVVEEVNAYVNIHTEVNVK